MTKKRVNEVPYMTKKRVVCSNVAPYKTRNLRKAIANRSRLENQYYEYKTTESLRAYKKKNKFVVGFTKRNVKGTIIT